MITHQNLLLMQINPKLLTNQAQRSV
jgi:hypothetical protein